MACVRVLQYHEAAGIIANDIDATDMRIGPTRRGEADHDLAIGLIAEHQLGGMTRSFKIFRSW